VRRRTLQLLEVVIKRSVILLAATLWLGTSLAGAQDEGLYAPAPPADAAFVRVLHTVPETDALDSDVGGTTFETLLYGDVSVYRVVAQGEATVRAGEFGALGELGALPFEAGHFYTVVLGEDATLFEDPVLENRAQTLLVLYNLSADPASLKTADGETDVITGVAPGELGSVPVNPISVAFGVFAGDTEVATFDEVQLERSAAYSSFVLPDGEARFVQNTTAAD
jgi:alginate O-acetyltransferase complex protein AlgF